MKYTIERLMSGDDAVAQQFAAAKDRWAMLLDGLESIPVDDLAAFITAEQHWFERNCGGRWKGQEVMAWTAFPSLYTTQAGWDGREDLGRKIAAAFAASMCSVEVKAHARRAARFYDLDD